MKILLINPPHKNIIDSEVPRTVNREVGIFPPLGLMYLASYLKKHSNHEVKILDAIAENMGYKAIQKYIQEYYPGLIGITAHTHNLLDVIAVAKIAKEVNTSMHISLGGPHVRIFPRETIGIPYVDSAISGEGEIIFTELAKAIAQNKELKEIKGLIFKDKGEVIDTLAEKKITDLDNLPFPDRNMINPIHYYYIINDRINFTTMLSSRGCPYHCSFCSTPRGSCRVRSPRNVVDEMEECADFGLNEIHFVDDTFNVIPGRVIDISEEIAARGLKIRWSFRGRVDTVTQEMLAKVKSSGCTRIHFGVETSNDEGLLKLKKGATIQQIKRVFQWTHKLGIKTVAYFMIGCPHERDMQDILRTIDFAIELNPDFAMFNVLTAYPSTELYSEGIKKGIFKKDYWKDFALHPYKDFILPVWEEWLSKDELFSLLNVAYKKFYLRPYFIFQNLFKLRSIKEFMRNLKTAIEISGL